MFATEQWFKKNNLWLLGALNAPIPKVRQYFREKMCNDNFDDRYLISKITPNSIHYKTEGCITAEFYSFDRQANRLKTQFEDLLMPLHKFDLKFANLFIPALNLGFDTLTAYSSTNDGTIQAYSNISWADAKGKTSGSAYSNIASEPTAMGGYYSGGYYQVRRSWFYFDTSAMGIGTTNQSAVFSLYGATNSGSDVSVQQGTQSATLVGSNFNSFTGSYFGIANTWTINTYNNITLDSSGVTFITNNSTSYLCAREYSHDYSNVAPTGGSVSGCYYSDNTGTTKDPKLVVTYTLPTTFVPQTIMIN